MSEQPEAIPVPDWTLGWRLRRSLEHGNVTVDEMANYLGYTRSSLSRWMHDKGKPPRPAVVKQWALRTAVSHDWLVGRVGLEPTAKGLVVRHLALVDQAA